MIYQSHGTRAFCNHCGDHLFTFKRDVHIGECLHPDQVCDGQSPFYLGDQLECKSCRNGLDADYLKFESPTDPIIKSDSQVYTFPTDGNWIIHLPKDITIKGVEYPTSGQALARLQGQYRRAGDSVEFTHQQPKCNHEFIDVGFSHSKLVCKHCDTEK